ncbi:MAG: pyridoxal-phosphate dependent enzyme, partial [Candidatus Eremiobacterales bacterium]
ESFLVFGSVVGSHTYPMLFRRLASTIGEEARVQCRQRFGRSPDHVVACVGGGSNAMGIFAGFIDDAQVRLWGVEAGGHGLERLGLHAASIGAGTVGVLHGARTLVLQDADGQIAPTHSISAGLDYPGVGPEHAHLARTGRARYVMITDDEARVSFERLARLEGIVPALESAHAVAFAERLAGTLPADAIVLVNLSGRGDKDAVRFALARATTAATA